MNIVVLGCGAVLEQCHRKPLQQVSKELGCQVVGVADPNPQRLAQARQWFPSAEGFPDAAACFAKLKDVALTVVTSPPPLHAGHIEAAVAHGSHVLCEKPLAGSVADAERILDVVRRHGRILSVGMTRRYYSCLAETRRRIRDGYLGNNLSFLYREGGVYGWPVASAAPFRRETSGGGVLLDKGAHALDSLEFLFGKGEVKRHEDDGLQVTVEANSVSEVSFEKARGIMQLSWDMNLNNGLHITGTEGECWMPIGPLNSLFVRNRPDQLWERIQTQASWPLDLRPKNGRRGSPVDYNGCFTFQLVQTLRAIRLGEVPAATGEEALATMRLIAAAYEMAAPLHKPWLPADEQASSPHRLHTAAVS